jgi:hypothetical protein
MKYEDLTYECKNYKQYKINIKYKKRKLLNKIFMPLLIILIVFTFLFAVSSIDSVFTNNLMQVFSQMTARPTTSLFDDNSKVYFVNSFYNLGESYKSEKLILPQNIENYTLENNEINLSLKDNQLISCGSGIITKVYTENGYENVILKFFNGMTICYAGNINLIVKLGEEVKQNQIIGLASGNLKLTFNDNIKIENGVIKIA